MEQKSRNLQKLVKASIVHFDRNRSQIGVVLFLLARIIFAYHLPLFKFFFTLSYLF